MLNMWVEVKWSAKHITILYMLYVFCCMYLCILLCYCVKMIYDMCMKHWTSNIYQCSLLLIFGLRYISVCVCVCVCEWVRSYFDLSIYFFASIGCVRDNGISGLSCSSNQMTAMVTGNKTTESFELTSNKSRLMCLNLVRNVTNISA